MYTIEVERPALLKVQVDGDTLKEALEKLHNGEGDWDLGDADMGDYQHAPTDIISVREKGDLLPITEADDKLLEEAKEIWKHVSSA